MRKHNIKDRDAQIQFLVEWQGYKDPVSGEHITIFGKPGDYATYHCQLHNTDGNEKNYPLLLYSVLSGMAVLKHNQTGLENRFTIYPEEARILEKYLQEAKTWKETRGSRPIEYDYAWIKAYGVYVNKLIRERRTGNINALFDEAEKYL